MKKVNERELRRAFGEALAEARGAVKLSALAERSGVTALNLNAFEAGTRTPDLADVYAIAAALDMHPAELLPVIDREAAPESDLYPEDEETDDDEEETE